MGPVEEKSRLESSIRAAKWQAQREAKERWGLGVLYARSSAEARRRAEIDKQLPPELVALLAPSSPPRNGLKERLVAATVRLREVGAQISRQEPHPPPALLREFSAIKAERNEIQEAQAAAGKEYALAQQAQGEAARVVRRAWLAGYSDKLTPATTKVLNAVGQLEEALTAYAAVYAPVERVGGCPPRAASDMQSYRDALEHLRSGLLAKLSAARGGGS